MNGIAWIYDLLIYFELNLSRFLALCSPGAPEGSQRWETIQVQYLLEELFPAGSPSKAHPGSYGRETTWMPCKNTQRNTSLLSSRVSGDLLYSYHVSRVQVCNKRFSSCSNLKTHLRLHSGERPYICKQCPASFTQHMHLQLHRRLHAAPCSHRCPHCSRSYTHLSSLQIHLHQFCPASSRTGSASQLCRANDEIQRFDLSEGAGKLEAGMEAESIKKMCQVIWAVAAPPVVQQRVVQTETMSSDSSSSLSPEVSVRQEEDDQ